MKRHGGGQTGLRTISKTVALAALLALTACATGPEDSGGRYVEKPQEWKAIDLTEADLNLPLVAPLEIASLERRTSDGQKHEDIYTFQGVKGYVKTSRLASGIFPESYASSLKAGRPRSNTYIAGLSLPPADRVVAPYPWAFLNGKSLDGKFLSRGFTAEGSARPYYSQCFIARTAYLMVDLEAIKRTPDAIDTVVEVLLCGNRGDLPTYNELVQMLARIEAVEDRDTFREELARRGIGTI